MKYFRLSWEEILWEQSWTNILMLSASIPKYKKEDKKEDVIETDTIEGFETFINPKK